MARSNSTPRRNFTPGEKLPHLYRYEGQWRWYGVARRVGELAEWIYYMNFGHWPGERERAN